MLSYALAIAVAISSLVLFSTAFLMSNIHRKDDFLWSGVGLFYALVLWYCARNITGAVLLGQAAATILVVSYSWQTIKLRRAIANPTQATETNSFSVLRSINGLIKRKKPQIKTTATPAPKIPKSVVTEEEIAIPETPGEIPTQTPETNIDTNAPVLDQSVEVNQAQVPDSQTATEAESAASPDVPNNPKSQVEKPVEEKSQPLPNKLPEVANKDETNPGSVVPSTNQDTEVIPAVSVNTAELAVEQISPTVTPTTAKAESPLDNLETVEVAEVLEAEADNQTNQRNMDQSNIIEVNTTEIDPTNEEKK